MFPPCYVPELDCDNLLPDRGDRVPYFPPPPGGSALVSLLYLRREALGGGERVPELLGLDRGRRARALREGEGRAHRAVLRVAQLEQSSGGPRGTAVVAQPFVACAAAARGEDRGEL